MKNNKIKIKLDYEKLSQEEIDKGKDFNKLYKNYTAMKTNWIKSPKGIGGLTSVLVVTVVVTVSIMKYKKADTVAEAPKKVLASVQSNTRGITKPVTHKFISPPIKAADIAYKTYTVNTQKGGELSYGDKTKIHIPKNCFVDKNGKEVKGDVTIKYREFHTPVDFFLSGIPMTYDSAGKQYTFQSAGMFDINGSKDGEPIQVKHDKNIQVDMASCGKGTNYNMYVLDTVQQKWVYTGKSKMAAAPTVNTTRQPAQADFANPEQGSAQALMDKITAVKQDEKKDVVPIKPQKAAPNIYSFDIKADAKDFPELAIYKNVLFQVDAGENAYNPKYAEMTWDDASLKRKTSTSYVFSVSNGNESHSFNVHPVVEGKDYDAAMKVYDAKYAAYQKSIADQKAEELKEEQAYQDMLKKQAEEAKVAQQQYQNAQLRADAQSGLENYFTVRQFGIWNNDCPENLPKGSELNAQFTDNQKDDLSGYDVFMIEKGRNALFVYHPFHPFCYDPNKPNFAWCVNQNNEVAILTPEEFQKIQQRKGDCTILMQVMAKKIKSEDDIKDMFKSFL